MSDSNEMTGGEALARMFQAHGTGPMFGMGGFQLLPFYDATRRLGLAHSLINDERCGAFAADAYAKVSGRVGVVDATLGPGATNLVTGLVEALNAGTAMVALVGDAHRQHAWKNMTQESRQLEILRPAVKEVLRVEMIDRIPELMRRAFQVATTGRPGPVVIDVPEDICHDTHPFEPGEFAVDPRYQAMPALRARPDAASVEAAAALLSKATAPLILAGGGVHISGANADLQRFAEAFNIPVAHTMTGKGAIACASQLSAGLFGRYDRIANALIEKSDCLLVVGCKLGEIATKRFTVPPKGKTVIHLEAVAEEIGRTYEPTVALGRCARGYPRSPRRHGHGLRRRAQDHVADVARRMAEWRRSVDGRLTSEEVPVNMARMIHELNGILPEDAVLVADGGFAAHWGGLLFDTKRAGRASSRTGASRPSATGSRLHGCGTGHGRAGRGLTVTVSTWSSASWRPHGAWGLVSRSWSSTMPHPDM